MNKVKKRCLVLLIICLLMILGFIWFLFCYNLNVPLPSGITGPQWMRRPAPHGDDQQG